MGCLKSKPDKTAQGETSIRVFRQQTLKAHNERRKKHGVPALKLSSDLNNYAQKWADNLAKSGTIKHSECTLKGAKIGENIASKWSSDGAVYTGEEVTQQWYREISQHNYSAESSTGSGHFTQVVWKDTKELGVGRAKDNTGKLIVVASYRPPGNFIGSFTKNVSPPK